MLGDFHEYVRLQQIISYKLCATIDIVFALVCPPPSHESGCLCLKCLPKTIRTCCVRQTGVEIKQYRITEDCSRTFIAGEQTVKFGVMFIRV